MHLTVIHMAMIILTLVLVIGIGIYQSRAVKSAAGYSVGGRSAGAPLVAGSIAGTVVGGGATVGTAQLAYNFGLPAWWFTLGSGIAFILMGIFYAKKMRSTALETIPQFLSLHYGKRAEELSSVISSIGILFSAVASCLPGIEIVADVFGVGPYTAGVLLLLLVSAYTFFGGMKSAGIGGMLKMAIIWLALFFAGFAAFSSIHQSSAWAAIPSDHFSLFGRGVEPALANLFSVIVGVVCTQTYIQCIFSASSPKVASLGCFLAALIVIPVGLPSVAIGLYMHDAYPSIQSIMVLPTFLTNEINPFLGGLAMGGILLSLVGGIGGLALGIGTMLARDMVGPLLHIIDDRKMLFTNRVTVLSVMALAAFIAILNRGSEVLLWTYLSMALRGGGIFLPLTLAVFWPGHIKKSWAVISMIGSTLASLITATVLSLPMDPLFAGLLVSALLLLPGIVVSGKKSEE